MKKQQQASPLSFSQGRTATQQQLDNDDDSLYYDDPPAAEESGWTTYLDDFSKQQQQQRRSSSPNNSSSYCSSSLVSDAASQYHHDHTGVNPPYKLSSSAGGGGVLLQNKNSKLSLIKKMRTKQKKYNPNLEDNQEDPLDDTGTSPVHSPKVINDFKRMEMKMAEGHGHRGGTFFGNEDGTHYLDEGSHEKRDGCVFSGHENHEYTSLKKRGLCLVPLSLFSNYIG